MDYHVKSLCDEENIIVVVGCGGTGSFLAEGLCRLLEGCANPIVLIDPDHIEQHNLIRQNFYSKELGMFKCQALAERLSRQYGRKICYSPWPFEWDFSRSLVQSLHRNNRKLVVFGCVDNASARQAIAHKWNNGDWWIDAGNGKKSGQILVGNISKDNSYIFEYRERLKEDEVQFLPIPSYQQPDLLIPVPGEDKPRDCAQAVIEDEQSPLINQMMATLALDIFDRLRTNTLSWMGLYVNLGDDVSLKPVPITPENVNRIVGQEVIRGEND
ncbi:MAG: ThiF family adenylyltransferase [Methylobacter sp.]|jgi:PRTRC genetic system ThiF family protein|nr:ThiF family adenylyltransferase [Methylobacter sp.]